MLVHLDCQGESRKSSPLVIIPATNIHLNSAKNIELLAWRTLLILSSILKLKRLRTHNKLPKVPTSKPEAKKSKPTLSVVLLVMNAKFIAVEKTYSCNGNATPSRIRSILIVNGICRFAIACPTSNSTKGIKK